MRAPEFWHRGQGGLTSAILAPLGWLYAAAGSLRMATARPWKSPVPMICIGNLVAGGAGKTPVALDFARHLNELGRAVHFVSRGYGGSERGPLQVDPSRHTSGQVGDEPLLLARLAPTWIATDREQGCRAAAEAGADIIIMDDGFQNPSVAKDLSVIVIDAGYGFGNGRIIPAGPLREPVAVGLARAQAIVISGKGPTDDPALPPNHPPVFRGALQPAPECHTLQGKAVVAFAGIGRPQKFFETLADLGCDIRFRQAFDDHHPYTGGDLDPLRQRAIAEDALLVTTEKDAVRLPPDYRNDVTTIAVSMLWEDDAAITELLEKVVKR